MLYVDPLHRALCKPVSLLAASVGATIIFLGLMKVLHSGLEAVSNCEPNAELAKERWALAWRMGCGAFHFTVPYYGLPHPIENAGIHLALLFIMLLLEIRFGPKEEEEEGSDKDEEGSEAGSIGERASRLSGYIGSHKSRGSQHGSMHGMPTPQRYPPHSAAAMMHRDPRAMEMLSMARRSPLEGPRGGRRGSAHDNPMHHY